MFILDFTESCVGLLAVFGFFMCEWRAVGEFFLFLEGNPINFGLSQDMSFSDSRYHRNVGLMWDCGVVPHF
jgi:hypothetical protein